MTHPILLLLLLLLLISTTATTATASGSCRDTCGSLPVKYPFGTGAGCGSPLFHPYITCGLNETGGDQLLLTTHTGSYPITSISYATSTLTITPTCMSTCSHIFPTPPIFGLDWTSPFSIASSTSTFILLSCHPPTSSLTVNNVPLCDTSSDHLCAAMYTCPSLFHAPTNTCCVYAPANLDSRGELNLRKLIQCEAYASVVSVGDNPTDPTRWEYGVAVGYSHGGELDGDGGVVSGKCKSCEISGGICGYGFPGGDSFVCVCKGGFNTSLDCSGQAQDPDFIWASASSSSSLLSTCWVWISILASLVWCLVMGHELMMLKREERSSGRTEARNAFCCAKSSAD